MRNSTPATVQMETKTWKLDFFFVGTLSKIDIVAPTFQRVTWRIRNNTYQTFAP